MRVSGAENGGKSVSRDSESIGAIRRGWGDRGMGHLGFGLSGERDRSVTGVSRSEAGQGRGPSVGKSVWKMGGFGGWAVGWGSQVLKIGGIVFLAILSRLALFAGGGTSATFGCIDAL